ncbi:MAG: UDP-glucose 4-epimerase GalE [Gammaproteobacteria bacterium]|nr:UDP-glucose 4-epimerase GalE [Gammaproteobacteria bacterium]
MRVKSILITGGAGYIGNHVVKALLEGHATRLIVLDNLTSGFADSLPKNVEFIQGDILDETLVSNILKTNQVNTVIHLAARTIIPESLQNPLKYYQNNTVGTLNLLTACLKHQVEYFLYSSTAAVYGKQTQGKIDETATTSPSNPYGHSKLMSEQIIQDTAFSSKLKYAILRYFNVAGAAPDLSIGQRTKEATHLVKVAVQTACGLQKSLPLFGTDYPTPDGTCIRDFIHVSDLANAHVKALHYLQEGGEPTILNCGYGHGYSVKEIVKAVEKITQATLPTTQAPRREGDIAEVIADNSKIKTLLQWQPQYDDIDFIVKTAYEWEKTLSKIKS